MQAGAELSRALWRPDLSGHGTRRGSSVTILDAKGCGCVPGPTPSERMDGRLIQATPLRRWGALFLAALACRTGHRLVERSGHEGRHLLATAGQRYLHS